MTTKTPKTLWAARPGDRVKFGDKKEGVIVRIDESVFPGVVIVRDDDGKEHAVHIGIGLPD